LSSERKFHLALESLTPQSSRGADIDEYHMRNTAAGQPRAENSYQKINIFDVL